MRSGSCASRSAPSLPRLAMGIFVDVARTDEISFQSRQESLYYPWKLCPLRCSCSSHSREPQPSVHLLHLPQSHSTCNIWNPKATTYYSSLVTQPASSNVCSLGGKCIRSGVSFNLLTVKRKKINKILKLREFYIFKKNRFVKNVLLELSRHVPIRVCPLQGLYLGVHFIH